MFDTYVTIVGNVLTAPDWRRTTQTNSLVAHFKVASTARRLNRETGRWVDGNSLRVRVNCWRKLAEGVSASIMVGDPVIVVGRLYTRDWTDAEGNSRIVYEMEAAAVGHDLARGRGRFARNRPTGATSAVEDAEAETRVRGEVTEAVPAEEAPTRFGDHPFDDASEPDFVEAAMSPIPGYDALAEMRGAAFDHTGADLAALAEGDGSGDDDDDSGDDRDGDGDDADEEAARAVLHTAVPGDGAEPDAMMPEAESFAVGASGGRSRRGRGRTPVPA